MIIPLKDPRYGVRIAICQNVETVTDGRDLEPWEDEATSAAGRAAQNVIFDLTGELAESSRHFATWHGGKYDRSGLIAAEFYIRDFESDIAEDGEEVGTWSGWKWLASKSVPAEVEAEVEAVREAAVSAMASELDRWEARCAEDGARFAAENMESD